MLRQLRAIIRKDVLVRFSNASELLFFLILPIVFTALLAGAVPDDGDAQTVLPVVLQEDGELATRLLAELQEAPGIAPREVTLQEAQALVDEEGAPALLIVPAGFGEQLQQGQQATVTWRALPHDTGALAVEQAVRAAVAEVSQAASVARASVAAAQDLRPFAGEAARRHYYEESLQRALVQLEETPRRLVVRQALQESQADDYSPAAQASAGQLVTWVFIPLLGTSALFAYERRQGTLRRLFTTPASKATFLLGTISSQMLMALVQMLLLVGFGIFALNLNWGRSPGALLLLLVAFALAAVALGTMLGTFITSEGQANGLSIMLGMAMALLGGCWYPLELFPPQVQTAVHVLPTTWAMRGLIDLVARGGGMAQILPEVAVLLGFSALFFVAGTSRFRYE